MHTSILPWTARASRLVRFRRASSWNRPSPPSLPLQQQREFEDLQRAAQVEPELDSTTTPSKPDFEGDVNPLTGEQGGPKSEPVRKWLESGGDWSFKGRVSDF